MCLRHRIYLLTAAIVLSAPIAALTVVNPAGAGAFEEPRAPRVYSNAHHFGYGLAPYPCGPAAFRADGAALDPYPPAGPPADLPDPIMQGQGVGLDLEHSIKRRTVRHKGWGRERRRYTGQRTVRHKARQHGKRRNSVYVGGLWVPFDNGPVELNGVPIERDCP